MKALFYTLIMKLPVTNILPMPSDSRKPRQTNQKSPVRRFHQSVLYPLISKLGLCATKFLDLRTACMYVLCTAGTLLLCLGETNGVVAEVID